MGTNFDPKELIFRNYAGALDSSSTPIARIEVLAGLPGEVKLIWLDPYMNVYSKSHRYALVKKLLCQTLF